MYKVLLDTAHQPSSAEYPVDWDLLFRDMSMPAGHSNVQLGQLQHDAGQIGQVLPSSIIRAPSQDFTIE
jgi:hypothetical protein